MDIFSVIHPSFRIKKRVVNQHDSFHLQPSGYEVNSSNFYKAIEFDFSLDKSYQKFNRLPPPLPFFLTLCAQTLN